MWWITTLSTQRLSATIILLWWDFLWELCNNNASTQISTRLFCFFCLYFPPHCCSVSSVQHSALRQRPRLFSTAAGTFADRKGTNCRQVEVASWQQIDREVLLWCQCIDEQYHEVQEVYYHHAGSFRSRPPQQERAHPTASQTLETRTVSCACTLVMSSISNMCVGPWETVQTGVVKKSM